MSHPGECGVHGLHDDVGDVVGGHGHLDVGRPPQLLPALLHVVLLGGGVPAQDHGVDLVEEGRRHRGEEELVQGLLGGLLAVVEAWRRCSNSNTI